MINQDLPDSQTLKILVVDDHELFLDGTIKVLQTQYPNAVIESARNSRKLLAAVQQFKPKLVLIDLSIPEITGEFARTETGLQLLQTLMQNYPTMNLAILSSNIKALKQLRPEIEAHQGGFSIADKSLPNKDVLARIDCAMNGFTHTKDLRNGTTGIEIKPEWLTVLNLAYREGLSDRAIAQRMNVSERTVRIYFSRIYDILGIYPEDCRRNGQNPRIQTEIRAREEGLLP